MNTGGKGSKCCTICGRRHGGGDYLECPPLAHIAAETAKIRSGWTWEERIIRQAGGPVETRLELDRYSGWTVPVCTAIQSRERPSE